jgi:hypothetical protein
MNVEIGTETAQFPEKEYINEIFFALWIGACWHLVKRNKIKSEKLKKRSRPILKDEKYQLFYN